MRKRRTLLFNVVETYIFRTNLVETIPTSKLHVVNYDQNGEIFKNIAGFIGAKV